MFSLKLFGLLLLLLIIGSLVLLFLKVNNRKEYFNEQKTETITDVLKKAKKEISTQKGEWLIYNASQNKKDYVLTPDKSIDPTYTLVVSKSKEGKILYTINGSNGKPSGNNGIQDDIGTPSTYGRFGPSMATITYKHGYERIIINIGTGKTVITGYGGFSNDNSYPDPWYRVMPIIYKDGGSVIGIMDYAGDKKSVKSSTTYLPMEIIVNKDNKKYLPLFFQVYVLLQKYISNLY